MSDGDDTTPGVLDVKRLLAEAGLGDAFEAAMDLRFEQAMRGLLIDAGVSPDAATKFVSQIASQWHDPADGFEP
ncbi:hypothetical protein JW805_01415 [Roseomonas aeriglobus]|nr:hypothetical protein [Roseomonas aeriglobus]